jgi:CRP/FNR family transcriptional regulator
MEDCEFLMIPQEAVIAQIEQNPRLALKMLSVMSARLRESNEQISSLAHLNEKGRVAHTLHKLFKKTGRTIDSEYQAIPKLSVKDIADMSGAFRETVSRTHPLGISSYKVP